MSYGAEHILIADDDESLCNLMSAFLQRAGMDVVTVHDGRSAINHIKKHRPKLVVLDIMLPEQDGLSVCRAVRSEYKGVIIMFTALDGEIDEVAGLELGADDYIKKPVSPRLLLARIRALLRRDLEADSASETIVLGPITVSGAKREVSVDGTPLSLSTVEFDVLLMLAENAGTVVSRDSIYEKLRRLEYDGIERSIDLYVSRIRKKLGDDARQPTFIKTVRRAGYLFVAP